MKAMLKWVCFYFILCLDIRRCETSVKNLNDQLLTRCKRSHSELTCSRIPSDIPIGIKSVRLINIDGTRYPDRVLQNGTFPSAKWGQVERLEISVDGSLSSDYQSLRMFDSYCFTGLTNLKKIHISLASEIQFTRQTFFGLKNLKLLDLSGCRRLEIDNLLNALTSPESVPNLRALNISLLNSYRQGIKLTDKFFKMIADKRIKYLDISWIQILYLNITSFSENCGTLEYLNMSRVMLNDYDYDRKYRLCPKLKYIDVSYVIFPSAVIPDRGPQRKITSNIIVPFNLNWVLGNSFLNVEYINLSGLTPKDTIYILNNVTVFVIGASKFRLKTAIMRDNNLERLDMKMFMPNTNIQKIDLSNCKLHFINPGLISSLNLLTSIDISNNRLNEMVTEDIMLFGKLFQNLTKLRYVNLAGNELTEIPADMFKYNSFIEVIDLSNNRLSQVSFDIKTSTNIKLIDLTRNVIKILDDSSMSKLDCLVFANSNRSNRIMTSSLLLDKNPITCSECDSLSFLRWLKRSQLAISDFSEMTCVTEHFEEVNIDQNAIDAVQEICNRANVIIAACIGVVAAIIVALILVFLIRRHRRQKQRDLEMRDRIALIREGAESHEFLVFLSFSSKDDDFVYNYVIGSLNENLQNMIGDTRNLVCEGDRNFQLGRPIHDQISELLKKSSVVVVVLSDNYSLSVHCRNEFDQAFMLEKPIVLMMKDEVNADLMMPLIRDIYEKRTRILWTRENGHYVLKTSWENVCTSILELVDES